MANKYNAKKLKENGEPYRKQQDPNYTGIVFDSRAEWRRWGELQLLERAGEISDIETHPRFSLRGYYKYKGETIRGVVYIADFRYKEYINTYTKDQYIAWGIKTHKGVKGSFIWVVEDVKGGKATQTDLFKLKWKMVIGSYGSTADFRIVEA